MKLKHQTLTVHLTPLLQKVKTKKNSIEPKYKNNGTTRFKLTVKLTFLKLCKL